MNGRRPAARSFFPAAPRACRPGRFRGAAARCDRL